MAVCRYVNVEMSHKFIYLWIYMFIYLEKLNYFHIKPEQLRLQYGSKILFSRD